MGLIPKIGGGANFPFLKWANSANVAAFRSPINSKQKEKLAK
jgi:hypothetical protein